MLRFFAGIGSALLMVAAAWLIWRSQDGSLSLLPPTPAPIDAALRFADVVAPPEASERTREEKRFDRYDKDRNGGVSREEYLGARRKVFVKFDVDKDGKLSFEEYATKTVDKFVGADKDRTGILTPTEFLATRVVRLAAKTKCAPPARQAPTSASTEDEAG